MTAESSQAGGERDFLLEGVRVIDALIVKSDCSLDRNQEFYDAAQWKDRARAALSAPPADPFREHLAAQAENINTERLDKALVLMGVARAGEGQEGFAARLAENVNRLTLAVTMHFAAPVAAVAQPVADAQIDSWLAEAQRTILGDREQARFVVRKALAASPSSERQDVGGGK